MATFLALLVLTSSLDRGPLRKVLRAASPDFKRCYEAALQRDPPGLEGRAQLKLTVSASGRVEEVEVTFPVEAPQFTQCLRDVAIKLRFLKGPAPYKLVWPVVFRGSDSNP